MGGRGTAKSTGRTTRVKNGIRPMSVARISRDTADEMGGLKRANVEWWKKEIKKVGIDKIEPPQVGYTKQGTITIINGRHRFTAAKELGYKKIPVKISR